MASIPKPGRPVRGSRSGAPIMALFDLLGRRWSMGVLWTLCDGGPCTFRALQERCESISPTVLNARLKELREAGLVRARRGPGGGYYLARAAERITVAEVFRVFEGPAPSSEPGATVATLWGPGLESQRGTGALWQALEGQVLLFLDGVSLADIVPADDGPAPTVDARNSLLVGRDPGVRVWH